MTCRLMTCRALMFALTLFAPLAFANAQQSHVDTAPTTRWQQWIASQKHIPVGAWAYNNALDDDALFKRYTSVGFNVVPKTHWSNAVVPADLSTAFDFEASTDRSIDVIQQQIKSGPIPAVVLLGQELVPDQFQLAAEQADAINIAADGAALPLNSLLPNWYVYFDRLNITYEQYVERFIEQAKPEALMAVDLPMMADGTDRVFYYDELAVLRRESIEHNIGLFGIIQAIGHGPRYRQPSASDLLWQVNTYLAYGAKGLWYYFFANNGVNDGLTTGLAWYPKQLGLASPPRGFGLEQTPASRQTLGTIQQLNGELAAWSSTLLKLQSTGVFYNGTAPPPGVNLMRDNGTNPFAQFSGDGLLAGFFRAANKPDGDNYVLIVNTRHGIDTQAAALENSVSFTLKPPFSIIDVIDPATGGARRLAAGQAGYSIHLSGGQGVLLRIYR